MIDDFVIIIGSMRSGTTSFFEYLSQHPQVCRCEIKEPEFFVREEKLQKGLEWYENLWNWDHANHRVALEASTSYTKLPVFPNAAERMARFARNFRFIYLMRDPVKRVASQIRHTLLATGRLQEEVTGELLDKAISYSRYATQIAEYSKRFRKEDVLLVRFEDFIRDPVGLANQASEFLGLDPTFEFKELVPQNEKYDLLLKQQLKRFKHLRFMVPRHLRFSMRSRISRSHLFRRLADIVLRPRIFLDRSAIEHIDSELREEKAILEAEYGLDTSLWDGGRLNSLAII
jgi:hypothetical protein